MILAAFPESRIPELRGKFTAPRGYANCLLDLHLYQCFGADWGAKTATEHVAAPMSRRARELRELVKTSHSTEPEIDADVREFMLRMKEGGRPNDCDDTGASSSPSDAAHSFRLRAISQEVSSTKDTSAWASVLRFGSRRSETLSPDS